MVRFILFALLLVYMVLSDPAQAAVGAAVPEPSDMALFALGLLGVILGRQGVLRHRRGEEKRDGED